MLYSAYFLECLELCRSNWSLCIFRVHDFGCVPFFTRRKERYEKNLALLLALVMLLVLTACGKDNEGTPTGESTGATTNTTESTSNSTDGTQDNTQGTTEGTTGGDITESTELTTDTIIYVGVDKIKNDLIAEEVNCFYLNNQATYLSIDSIEILKRKSGTEYDEVHIAVVFSNAYYVVNAEYILYYGYYNVGGWCLDDYMLSEYQSKAIASPVSDSDFIAFMRNHFSSCSITNRTQSTDAAGVYTDNFNFTATLDYAYLTISFSGWYTMQFYNDCWYDTFDFWIDNYDWSAFENTFRYRNRSFNMGAGFYSADVKISLSNIEQVSEKKLSVTYSASVYLYDKTGGYVENDEEIAEKTRELTISTERITILGKEIEVPQRARYISLPWYGTFAVFLCRDNGVEATDNTDYGNTFAHFDRVVSDDELQDAMDRLEGLNP